MTDQSVFQGIAQSYRRSFLCRVCFVVAHSNIKTALLPVRVQNDKNSRIIRGQRIEYCSEFVCDRFTFSVDHFRDVVHTDIIDQVFLQRKELADRCDLHFCKSAEIFLSQAFPDNLQTVFRRKLFNGDRSAFTFFVDFYFIHTAFPLIPLQLLLSYLRNVSASRCRSARAVVLWKDVRTGCTWQIPFP